MSELAELILGFIGLGGILLIWWGWFIVPMQKKRR